MATPPWVGKGGSGKSTLATNLAVMARRSELKSAPQGSSFVG